MTYQPKVGDRVRVTLEGEVTTIGGYLREDSWRVGGRVSGDSFAWVIPSDAEVAVTVEKLQDPEPEWVNGDVIEIKQALSGWVGRTLHRIDGKWHWPEGDTTTALGVSNVWKGGGVKILYKADSDAKVA